MHRTPTRAQFQKAVKLRLLQWTYCLAPCMDGLSLKVFNRNNEEEIV